MLNGERFWVFGEMFEVITARGASIFARPVRGGGIVWIIEDDLP